jgi:hypothetical protein
MNLQETRNWALSHPRIKDRERRLMFAAMDSFETLYRAGNVSPDELTAVIEAARSPWVAVWGVGGRLLAEFARRHGSAQITIRALATSRKRNERFQAIDSLSAEMPKTLLQELLTLGLNDHSKLVRRRAAMKCDTLRLREMLPEMMQRAAVEPDSQVKHSLEFHAAMIRDGYLIERKGGNLTLRVRVRNGWSSQLITQDDIDGGRVPALVAEALAGP